MPIFVTTHKFEYKGADCTRTQFPLRVAYAITVYKSQGLTLPQVVLNIELKGFAPGLTNVAVSRVKRIAHIMFETPFDMQRFKIGSNQTVENRALDWAYRTRQCISPMYVAPVA